MPDTNRRRLSASSITDDQLDALYAERDALLDELDGRSEAASERWIEKQLAETGLRAMDFRNGMSMDIEPARELVAQWVGAARAMLGDAPNYTETPIEMHVKVAESPERFAFVLQRVAPGALTPHQARQKAEEQRDQARQAIEAVHDVCDALQAEVHGLAPVALAGRRDAVARIRAVLPPKPGRQRPVHVGGDPEFCPACRALPGGPVFPQCPGPDAEGSSTP